ncbi:MAG: selenobiotic family peptide radical SAM maturase [Polyangiaceae bacterium]|nr:selenobiotic family peptide radical SAM maturase [Polyangiaceae bacterium]
MLRDGRLFGRTSRHFTLQWHLTHACTEACRHCYDRAPLPTLGLPAAQDVLVQLKAFCDRRQVSGGVCFTGGDPFLYPRFFDLYRAAAEAGFSLSVLGNPVGDAALDSLLAIRKPRYFQLSLEGAEAVDDAIRGPGHYARVMECLARLRERRVRAHVMLTLHRENLHGVEALAEALAGKVDRLLYNRLAQVGEGAALEQPTREEYVDFMRRWFLLAKRFPFVGFKDNLLNIPLYHFGQPLKGGCTGAGCGAAFNFLALLPNGELHACRKLPSPLGSVVDQGLEATWESEAAARYRVGCEACNLCPIRNRCGGCLAVGHGMGLDPLEQVDPHCFFDDRAAMIRAAARAGSGAQLAKHLGGDGGGRKRGVDPHAEALVQRAPLVQLRRDRGDGVDAQEIGPVHAVGRERREPRSQDRGRDVQKEHPCPVAEQAAGGRRQDGAGAGRYDRAASGQALAQERPLGGAKRGHAVLLDECGDRPQSRFDQRVHVEVGATKALGEQRTDGGLARARVADQDDVGGHRLLRDAGGAPGLLVLELTRRCGRKCDVCFHRDMREIKLAQVDMSPAVAERALELASQAGVRRVRLTGGEPLRHRAFVSLLREIHERGFETWVNTAGLPEGGTPWELIGELADDVLLPLRDAEQRAEIAAAVRAIRRGGSPRVRLGVVLTPEHVAELPAIVGLSRELGCFLEAYRVMSVPGQLAGSTAAELLGALEQLDELNRGFPPDARARVANAVPFCVAPDRRFVARNCFGARFDDGRDRLVVSPEGEIRPSYSLRLSLGHVNHTTLVDAWRHPTLLALHSAEGLPRACQSCADLAACRGGSRHEAQAASGDLSGMDPLALS